VNQAWAATWVRDVAYGDAIERIERVLDPSGMIVVRGVAADVDYQRSMVRLRDIEGSHRSSGNGGGQFAGGGEAGRSFDA
jgi:hypothetical protein